jgi:hypothetical protein
MEMAIFVPSWSNYMSWVLSQDENTRFIALVTDWHFFTVHITPTY